MTAQGLRSYMQIFSRFGLTWHRKVNFSTFSGKLTFQSTRNGPQNLPFCPGSLQDTFIIFLRYITNICSNKKWKEIGNRFIFFSLISVFSSRWFFVFLLGSSWPQNDTRIDPRMTPESIPESQNCVWSRPNACLGHAAVRPDAASSAAARDHPTTRAGGHDDGSYTNSLKWL